MNVFAICPKPNALVGRSHRFPAAATHWGYLVKQRNEVNLLSVHPYPSSVSDISPQRNGSLFGNHVNHVSGDKQGYSHLTTVTQRPLQILPFCGRASVEPAQTGRRASDVDRGGEREMNSPSVQYNHHCHAPHPYIIPHCHQSPIPSNANLNNANVPSILSMTNGRQQKCLLAQDRPSSTKNSSLACTYSKGVHSKPWKSHSTRSVWCHEQGTAEVSKFCWVKEPWIDSIAAICWSSNHILKYCCQQKPISCWLGFVTKRILSLKLLFCVCGEAQRTSR